MSNRNFTLMVVPDGHGQARRFPIRRSTLYVVLLAGLMGIGALGALVVHYSYVVGQVFDADQLRAENTKLRERLSTVTERVQSVEQRLAEARRLDEKLRAMTDLHDDARALAMGPLRPALDVDATAQSDIDPFAVPLQGEDPVVRQLEDALLDSRLVGLAHEATRQLSSLTELVDYYSARDQLLASTPSVWPTQGWITSSFGRREDPYTGEHVMHAGIDLAAAPGVKVVAPARGVVIYAGERGAYGNMIAIDHGRGIITHYGHLSRILVKVGDVVERGHHIGAVGNTGRSTGPHLHYEIRLDGVPVNPRRFVLQ